MAQRGVIPHTGEGGEGCGEGGQHQFQKLRKQAILLGSHASHNSPFSAIWVILLAGLCQVTRVWEGDGSEVSQSSWDSLSLFLPCLPFWLLFGPLYMGQSSLGSWRPSKGHQLYLHAISIHAFYCRRLFLASSFKPVQQSLIMVHECTVQSQEHRKSSVEVMVKCFLGSFQKWVVAYPRVPPFFLESRKKSAIPGAGGLEA